jgi:hypothetical protein
MASAPSIAAQLVAPAALVLQLLEWVAARPRTYRETMDAWRTSCPRMPVWEDAVDNGLVEIVASSDEAGALSVALTARGRAALALHAL